MQVISNPFMKVDMSCIAEQFSLEAGHMGAEN